MKKNLRIVSAAAAALLAVAPVAATVVPSANAASVATNSSNVFEDNSFVPAVANVNTNSSKAELEAAAVSSVNAAIQNASFKATVNNESQTATVTGIAQNNLKLGTVTRDSNGTPVSAVVTGTVIVNLKSDDNFNANLYSGDNSIKLGKNTGKISNYGNGSSKTAQATFTINQNVNFKATDTSVKGYFATTKNNALAQNATVYAKAQYSNAATLGALKEKIQKNVLGESTVDWNKVWNTWTTNYDLIKQLENQGITVNGTSDNASFDASNKQYSITVAAGSLKATVVFQNTSYVDAKAPVLLWNNNGQYIPLTALKGYVGSDTTGYAHETMPIVVPQNDDASAWKPTTVFSAYPNATDKAFINVSFSDDNVDITKAGLYHITVTAKNAAGKTTTAVVPVVVSASNGRLMTVVKDTNIYSKDANGKMVQANPLNFSRLATSGSQITVYGEPVTVDGVQYYHVYSADSNFFVRADALKNGVTTPANTATKDVTVMHIAAVYNKEGKQTSADKLRAYNSVKVVSEPVTINGAKFYELADKAADGSAQYIKVSNIDGTSKTLKKNSYIYKRRATGSFYATKASKKNSIKAGTSKTVYGGKLYGNWYRVGKNEYIRSRNF